MLLKNLDKCCNFIEPYNTKNCWVANRYFLCLLITLFIIGSSFPTIALEEKLNTNDELATLQTEITQNKLKIIEQLVTIAERHSPQVQEAKAAMGWRAFQDIVFLELSPSLSTTSVRIQVLETGIREG